MSEYLKVKKSTIVYVVSSLYYTIVWLAVPYAIMEFVGGGWSTFLMAIAALFMLGFYRWIAKSIYKLAINKFYFKKELSEVICLNFMQYNFPKPWDLADDLETGEGFCFSVITDEESSVEAKLFAKEVCTTIDHMIANREFLNAMMYKKALGIATRKYANTFKE